MKRPKGHIIGDAGVRIFSQSIPAEWIARIMPNDYGLDVSVEIVEKGNVSGAFIYAQVKGEEHPIIIDGHLSYSLEVKNLVYYNQIDTPVILVVVDINNEKCYWVFLQRYISEILDIDNPSWTSQKSVTVKVPLENEVSITFKQLDEIARGGPTYLIVKKIDRIPNEYLCFWRTNAGAIKGLLEVAEKLNKKQFQIKFEASYKYEKEGDRENSNRILLDIYNTASASGNDDSYVRAAFAMTYIMNALYDGERIIQILKSIRKAIDDLGNVGYDIYWRAIYLETIFAKLVQDYDHNLMLQLVASQTPEGIMAPFLNLEIQKIVTKILSVMNEMLTCIRSAYEKEEYIVFLDLLERIAKMEYLWCYQNSFRGNAKVIYNNLKNIESLVIFAKNLANKLSKDYEFELLLDLARLYGSLEKVELRDKSLDEAMNIAKELEHKGYQIGVENIREAVAKSPTIPFILKQSTKPSEPSAETNITDEEEEEMIKHLLSIAGFYKDKKLAELAEIGLKDRNPERILKHCENLYVAIVTHGPIWDMVGLPETGLKILYCEKEGSIMGQSLDEVLEMFKKDKCKNCKNHLPRPYEWKWTRGWHKTRPIPDGMKKTIENFFKL